MWDGSLRLLAMREITDEASEAALKAVVDELQLPFGLFDWQVVFIRLIISISALGRFLR